MPTGPVLETFERPRPLLFFIAYRMLGNASDAEDAVRESYLRWLRANFAAERDPRSPKAYLSAAMVRLCLDRMSVGPSRREEHAAGVDASLSMALLVSLESLTPTEQAAFLLQQVFGHDPAEVASRVGESEAACRQIARRSKRSVVVRCFGGMLSRPP